MFLPEIEDRLILTIEHLDRSRHEATHHNKLAPTGMPREIMDRPILSFHGRYLILRIVVDEQAEFSIIRFP